MAFARTRPVCVALLLAGVPLAGAAGTALDGKLEVSLGEQGVSSLKWAGIELADRGPPRVESVVFERTSRDEQGLRQYAFEKLGGGSPQARYDAAARRLVYGYAWGSVEFVYSPRPDRLDLTVTIANRSDRTLADFDLTVGSIRFPALPMAADGFSVRWTGKVEPRYSETYTFHATTDDGVRLWVDGRLLIDKWIDQAPTEHSGQIALSAGRKYDIKMEYYENSGGASAVLAWSSPSQAKQVVPPECLAPGSGKGRGLTGEYFSDRRLEQLRFTRVDPKVSFDWGTGSPEGPGGLSGSAAVRSTLDNVAILETAFGAGGGAPPAPLGERAALCCLTMWPPIRFGLDRPRDSGRAFDIVARGGVYASEPGGVEIHPHGLPRVEPGRSLSLEFSLRFARTGGTDMAADVCERFRRYHSPPLVWPDRRGIGMLMLSSVWEGHKSATNPRGWFNEKAIDVKSEAGRADFRARALEYARRSVAILKEMNAQGMIVWDVEGQENPHPISYIGDPRMARLLAPEMDEVADEFFKTFLDAGLRTGVCIRPTQVYFDEGKKRWDHGTGSHGPERNPLGDDFSAVWPKGLPWWRFFPVAERLCRKIEYAKKRWGCTIFYVDTNGTYRPVGEQDKFQWMLLDAEVWRQVRKAHPDVLIVPELVYDDFGFHAAYWAHTAPYFELDLGGVSTPAQARRLFPSAFSVLNMCDGPFAERRAELVEAVRRGDILMFHGWWSPDRNREVKGVYDEVYKPGAKNPGLQ